MRYFSEEHQWVELDDSGVGTIGITSYAIDELGNITFVELPTPGAALTQGEVMCVVESAKAASDVLAPVSGTVSEVNAELDAKPEILNASPEAQGWICRIEDVDTEELDSLMTESRYETFLSSEEDED